MTPHTFTRHGTTSHVPSTGRMTPSTTEIAGAALGLSHESAFKTFGMIGSDEVALFFVTQTFGDRVRPGDTCTWDGEGPYTVKRTGAFVPDGPDLYCRVLIGK
jgi:hypothetical protein